MLQTTSSSGKVVLYDYAGDSTHSEQMWSEVIGLAGVMGHGNGLDDVIYCQLRGGV